MFVFFYFFHAKKQVMKLTNFPLEKIETLPSHETISLQKATNGWYSGRSYYRGNGSYWKVKTLVDGYIGRPFSELYWKVKPLLKTESKPMSELIRWHFSEGDDYYIDKNGLVAFNGDKKTTIRANNQVFLSLTTNFIL
jgi:ABC-type phosphate transport system substrate-binding protein